MRKYESICVRLDLEYGADQFRADTLDEAKAWVLDKVLELKSRQDITEENREYWLKKYSKPIFVHRIVIEDLVRE